MDEIINLTPHEIVVYGDGIDDPMVIHPEETPARVTMDRVRVGAVCCVPVYQSRPGPVIGLPDTRPGTWYVVSRVVASVLPLRTDLLVPDDILRDENGVIIGCRSFCVI